MISGFQSISARTAGFSAIDNFYDLAASSQLLKISLMFIGTAPASMGGGITTSTLIVLLLFLWAFARGYQAPHIFWRSLGLASLRRIGSLDHLPGDGGWCHLDFTSDPSGRAP